MSVIGTGSWADVLVEHAATERTSQRLIGQLRACEVAAIAFCRLLERWARGEAEPCTPGRREAALQRAADRVETAITGLEQPLSRYLLELEPETAEGRSWYGEPGAAELVEWSEVLTRAGVRASPTRVAQVYLELADHCVRIGHVHMLGSEVEVRSRGHHDLVLASGVHQDEGDPGVHVRLADPANAGQVDALALQPGQRLVREIVHGNGAREADR